jgi:tripartite-type tricarboxylate transporter receptor subunit TctC
MKLWNILGCAAAAALLSTGAAAQSSKVMKIIVPYAAGGVTDAVAREMAARLTDLRGSQVIVENRPGASSIIGMQACAKAAPDGLTTCIAVPDSLSYNPQLFSNLPYDPDRDFAPVINLGFTNNLLVASAKAKFSSYKEMIAYAKAHPGAINWATWGAATLPDIFARWIAYHEGISIVPVPYKGSAGTIPAVLSGEADITYMGFGTALPHIKAGKMKPLVATSAKRSRFMPELPSLGDEGGDPRLVSYFAIFAPAATPRATLQQMNAEFEKAIATPEAQNFFQRYTIDHTPNTIDEFAAFAKADRENAAKVFKSIGIQPSEGGVQK